MESMLINNIYGRFASFFKNHELKEADKYIKRVFPNAEFYLDYEHALVFERIGEDLEALKMDEYSHVECSRCWIKGTRRGFILDLDEYIDDWNDEGKIAIGLEAEFAWGISSEELLNSCKQYGVDMRIHAFECGMCFNQIIEIIDGEITKDEEVKFDDYNWDCICPNVGG